MFVLVMVVIIMMFCMVLVVCIFDFIKIYGFGMIFVRVLWLVIFDIFFGWFIVIMGVLGLGKLILLYCIIGFDFFILGWVWIGDIEIIYFDDDVFIKLCCQYVGFVF